MDDGNGGSDTNILVAVDAANGYIYGVSIPRDTKAVFNGKSHKINAAYNTGGMKKLAEVVSDQLGIPVDYTVLVDLRGFEALVDAIGGVNFTVPVDMDYDDPVQDLHIHFTKGAQHLSGAENIDFSTLPGDWKSPYIYLDQEETLALVNQYLNPYVEDRTAADLHIPG